MLDVLEVLPSTNLLSTVIFLLPILFFRSFFSFSYKITPIIKKLIIVLNNNKKYTCAVLFFVDKV